jgi:hypothetical protein
MQSSLSPTNVVDQALAIRATQAENDRAFFALSPAQRTAAMWRALLGAANGPAVKSKEPVKVTLALLYRWAARFPNEVPLINGEFAFIAALGDANNDADLEARRRAEDARIIAQDKIDRVRHPERTIAARLRAEAERLRAHAAAEAKS